MPREYQQVEYLQSSGTQFIDTGIRSSNDLEVIIRAAKDGTGYGESANGMFGQRRGAGSYYFVSISNGYVAVGYNAFSTVTNKAIRVGIPNNYDVIYNGGVLKLTVDGNIVVNTTTSRILDTGYMYLFGLHDLNGGIINSFAGMIYSCKIATYNNGDTILLRDFIPCYRKSDNVAGMYDFVSQTFFINSGTGTFVVGPNV